MTRDVHAALEAAGLRLPPAPTPVGSYLPAVRAGDLVFVSGQLPFSGGSLLAKGVVGGDVSLEQARECARAAALNALSAARTVCDLDAVTRVVRLTVYVAASPGFESHPSVADGASEVLVAAFGEDGLHSRVAVGVAALPLGAPLELDLLLHLAPS